MKFAHILYLCVLLPLSGYGAAGMFDQFIIVNTGPVAYYDIGAATGNPDFQGTNLGDFTSGGSLVLGGQGKSYKNGASDVTGMALYYRVWQGSPGGAFTPLNYAFQINIGGGDQQWGSDVAGANGSAFFTGNLLTGLSEGDYSLEVYSQISTNGLDGALNPTVNNNSGNNFIASFSVVPEPSRMLLVFMGFALVFTRRRRNC